jgi:hypothetical protein
VIGDHGAVADQTTPMSEETAGIADDDGGNSDLGGELNQTGVGSDDLGDERGYLVVEIPGVGSRLNDEGVGGLEMNKQPTKTIGKARSGAGKRRFRAGD